MLEQLNDLLPQTQCRQCGYKGCRPYAQAILSGEADINQCPPSGDEGIAQIAALLGCEAKPLNTQFGEHKPKNVALIIEDACIGCMKCIIACPVDAIIGASKCVHTVMTDHCTGCELCVPPCPVDCIIIQLREDPKTAPSNKQSKARYEMRLDRLENERLEKSKRLQQQKALLQGTKKD